MIRGSTREIAEREPLTLGKRYSHVNFAVAMRPR